MGHACINHGQHCTVRLFHIIKNGFIDIYDLDHHPLPVVLSDELGQLDLEVALEFFGACDAKNHIFEAAILVFFDYIDEDIILLEVVLDLGACDQRSSVVGFKHPEKLNVDNRG